jgi:hypothetical protein
MTRRSAVVAVLALAGLLAACADGRDPASVARAALEAYRSRDLAALADLAHPDNREILEELRRDGEAHPRWASLFSPDAWRWQAVQAWDGRVGEVRYFGEGSGVTAMVRFGEISASELAVVALELRDDRWWFEDVNSPPAADFAEGRTAP